MENASEDQKPFSNQQIRVSVGTAIVLGLLEGKQDAEPTTAYLMTYTQGKCLANCGFCPQARNSYGNAELLSRVSWPAFSANSVIAQIGSAAQSAKVKRVCIQALNYPNVFSDISFFVRNLKRNVSVPVSVSCQPLNSQNMWLLAQSGVDRIGIALDAATEKIFNTTKGKDVGGPYDWEEEFTLLHTAIGIFGEGNVSTHLIVGLGETEKEAVGLLQTLVDMGVLPGLFTFTPVRGTDLSQITPPQVETYRRLQLARFLLVSSMGRQQDMTFNAKGEIESFGISKNTLTNAIESGKPFQTSGCKDCNRPFYNEKPSGPLYNYPRPLASEEIKQIELQLKPLIE